MCKRVQKPICEESDIPTTEKARYFQTIPFTGKYNTNALTTSQIRIYYSITTQNEGDPLWMAAHRKSH
ncbi:hypothetical protein KDI_23490 [Dictyobacter arantiisoli]|uniref:Uncharacterized protein n=1 Tax=Dictyobacter arantiisoli TaxID=2014874 RepID=A0A5A5TC55_9CHLR|nr:hypothetical protein KDI_23490 [Dictyobacter arantiisoli]